MRARPHENKNAHVFQLRLISDQYYDESAGGVHVKAFRMWCGGRSTAKSHDDARRSNAQHTNNIYPTPQLSDRSAAVMNEICIHFGPAAFDSCYYYCYYLPHYL